MNRIGECEAVISKIATTVDGGVRLTLDLNAMDAELIKKLMDLKIRTSGMCVVAFLTQGEMK